MVAINSVGSILSWTKGSVELGLSSQGLTFKRYIRSHVMEEIAEAVPNESFSINDSNLPKNIQLSDPEFNIFANAELLLGLQIFWKILGSKLRH